MDAGDVQEREDAVQTASKTGDTESVDEDRNYEKVCFTGPRRLYQSAETTLCMCESAMAGSEE
jgi:hypothetical protein